MCWLRNLKGRRWEGVNLGLTGMPMSYVSPSMFHEFDAKTFQSSVTLLSASRVVCDQGATIRADSLSSIVVTRYSDAPRLIQQCSLL
jgi:hypothetical protein